MCCYCISTKQKQKRKREEPSLEQDEDLDAVEAFKTCHTSSKHGMGDTAKKALVRSVVCFIPCTIKALA
jgi:hypothetical protein